MSDQPALPPADDDDRPDLVSGRLIFDGVTHAVIREDDAPDRWIASSRWLEWDDRENGPA